MPANPIVSRETILTPTTGKPRGDVVIAAERLPMVVGVTERFGIDRAGWKALVEAVFPSAKTSGAIVLALAYCKARRLDIFKRVVHIVPMWNSELNREVETVWPGIAEHRTTASRTGSFAGNDACVFGPWIKQRFKGEKTTRKGRTFKFDFEVEYPESAQVTVYRMIQGARVAFVGPACRYTEYFGYRSGVAVPNERWTRAPSQMLEKCAEAAALRRAYPEELSEPTAEEMEGRIVDAGGVPIGAGDPEPALSDFRADRGVPKDGVEVVDEDDDELANDPAAVAVKPAPAAEPQAEQGGAPAPASEDPGDPRDEPANAAGAPEREPAKDVSMSLPALVDHRIASLATFYDPDGVGQFGRNVKAEISEFPAPEAERTRERGRWQAAVLERERAVARKKR